MSNIKVGQTIQVSARFVDFDPFAGTDDLLDPDTVSAALYQYDFDNDTFNLISSLTPVTRVSLGVYSVNWTTTSSGLFRILLIGYLNGATPSTIENPRDFYVGNVNPTVTLGKDIEYYFLGELDPLYLDPEVVLTYFPEGNLVEITEIIYRLSLVLESWFGENLKLTSLMEEWLLAATLCELSKIYTFDGGMGGFGGMESYTLGDLTVKNSTTTGSNSRTSVYAGNATSWCELAAYLKDLLNNSRANFKSVVRGAAWCNPMPDRRLKRYD